MKPGFGRRLGVTAGEPLKRHYGTRRDGIKGEAMARIIVRLPASVGDAGASLEGGELFFDPPAFFVSFDDRQGIFGRGLPFGRQQQPIKGLLARPRLAFLRPHRQRPTSRVPTGCSDGGRISTHPAFTVDVTPPRPGRATRRNIKALGRDWGLPIGMREPVLRSLIGRHPSALGAIRRTNKPRLSFAAERTPSVNTDQMSLSRSPSTMT